VAQQRAEQVVVRPFRPDELPAVWAVRVQRGSPSDRNARRRFARTFAHWCDGAFREGFLQLAIDVGGRLAGDVQARRPKHGLPPGVYEIGIELYDPADRGNGYGGAAVGALTELLFREHGAGRVQASTSLDNVAMRRVLERLGFVEEGVLRGFWPHEDGSREDYVLYAVTAADRENP
jgi:RimJ/RimL family protein N-acetyltransferase